MYWILLGIRGNCNILWQAYAIRPYILYENLYMEKKYMSIKKMFFISLSDIVSYSPITFSVAGLMVLNFTRLGKDTGLIS